MTIYETRYRDSAGHHRIFDATKREAMKTMKELTARMDQDDPNNQMDLGQIIEPTVIFIPTKKAQLVAWLNANAENADQF